jgi:hypothetical protein
MGTIRFVQIRARDWAVPCAVLGALLQVRCTLLFPFAPLRVEQKEEIRLPPTEQAPLFTDPPRHQGAPGGQHHFGAALAAGHFTRAVPGDDDLELVVGVPGADGGGVVRFAKPAAGGEVPEDIRADAFGLAGAESEFGAALAAGDFDADGFDDLAIGAPGHGLLGTVAVLYGGAVRRTTLAPPDAALGARRFGSALAAGDLNDDGADDLVVGEPGSDRADAGDPGRVWVVWGRPAGELLSMQASVPLAIPVGDEQRNDTLFGASVAVGSLVLRPDRSLPIRLDLAVGAPGFDHELADRRDVGKVYVFASLVPDGFELAGTLEPANGWEQYARRFGHALAAGNFNDDRDGPGGEEKDDLAIGAPLSSIPAVDGLENTFSQPSGRAGHKEAGLVFLAAHGDSRVSAPLRVLSQDRMGLSQKGDHFGWALAAGNFNDDPDDIDDLAIGSPNERMAGPDVSGVKQAGAVYFRFGNDGAWLAGGGIPQLPVACFDYIDAVRGTAESRKSDRFGSVLAAALFDDDDAVDLLVGAPETDVAAADGVVRDAGAVWIGRNQDSEPGRFEGTFRGGFPDDCGGDDPAVMEMIVTNREDAVCGVLTSDRLLCFDVDDEEVIVEQIEVSVVATNLGDAATMHLEYVLRDQDRKKVGTLAVDAELFVDPLGGDADEDLRLDLAFDGSGPARGVERTLEDLVLERQ